MELVRWMVPALVVGGLALFLPRRFGGLADLMTPAEIVVCIIE